jgi:hypothetical protein
MRGRAWLLAALAAACQGPPPPAPPAEVSIEILAGFAERAAVPAAAPERVAVLLDVTASTRAGPRGAEPYRAARAAAARFVERLPEDRALHVQALGLTPGNGCASATALGSAHPMPSRATLASRLARLEPAGEGSLAVALAELRGVLVQTGAIAGSRVVVFSDLGSQCGGDLCTAAGLLLDDGARLDLVVVGDGAAPACLAELAPAPEPPAVPPLAVPRHRIVAYDPAPDRQPLVLAEGLANGSRLRVPAGPVTVLLGFDPPSLIGPLVLSPGAWTRIRVVEFPSLDPPVREWVWGTQALPGGSRAAP